MMGQGAGLTTWRVLGVWFVVVLAVLAGCAPANRVRVEERLCSENSMHKVASPQERWAVSASMTGCSRRAEAGRVPGSQSSQVGCPPRTT